MRRNKSVYPLLWALAVVIVGMPFGMTHSADDLSTKLPSEMTAADESALPSPDGGVPQTASQADMSMLDLVKKGGIVGYCIILLSVFSLALIIDYGLTIRRAKILPVTDIEMLKARIEKRDLNDLDSLERRNASFLCRVAAAGLKESHLGYAAMVKAMEDAGEALSAGIARKIEHLNVIGNISPMLGLLGTVIGMLRCFNELSHMAGAIEPKQLAGGIFEALVTTCMGLIVAIPALYCYALFRNRVDEYTGEAALKAEQLMAPFKRDAGLRE